MLCGYSADKIYELFKEKCSNIQYVEAKNILKLIYGLIFKRKIIINGFNSGKIIEKIVKEICKQKCISNINQIKKKLVIPAINAHSGKVHVFNSCNINCETKEDIYIGDMDIGKVVRSSCSFPVIFSPCEINGEYYLDGGIKENVPWKETMEVGAEKVVSILFEKNEQKKCCNNLVEVATRSFELLCDELSRHELMDAQFIHRINLNDMALLDYSKTADLYNEGYVQTKIKLKQIKDFITNEC